MSKAQVEAQVAKLSDLRCAEEAIRARYAEQIAAATKPFQDQIDELQAGIKDQLQALDDQIQLAIAPLLWAQVDEIAETKNEADQLEKEVREGVLALGETVKAGNLQVQYVRASIKWNADMLAGLALKIPEVKDCGTLGKPTTRIVPV